MLSPACRTCRCRSPRLGGDEDARLRFRLSAEVVDEGAQDVVRDPRLQRGLLKRLGLGGIVIVVAGAVFLREDAGDQLVVVGVGRQFLLVHAVRHQAVQATHVAPLDGRDLVGQHRARAGVIVNLQCRPQVDLGQVRPRPRHERSGTQPGREGARTGRQRLERLRGRTHGHAQTVQVVPVNKLRRQAGQVRHPPLVGRYWRQR
jgi:hypothetical protein